MLQAFWIWSGAKECESCRSRKMLKMFDMPPTALLICIPPTLIMHWPCRVISTWPEMLAEIIDQSAVSPNPIPCLQLCVIEGKSKRYEQRFRLLNYCFTLFFVRAWAHEWENFIGRSEGDDLRLEAQVPFYILIFTYNGPVALFSHIIAEFLDHFLIRFAL